MADRNSGIGPRAIPPNLAADSLLSNIIATIADIAGPCRILLFGSRARGEECSDSDYDFLIIKPGLGNERVLTRAIYRAFLANGFAAAVDLIAVDEAVFERRKWESGLIYSTVLREGVLVYG